MVLGKSRFAVTAVDEKASWVSGTGKVQICCYS